MSGSGAPRVLSGLQLEVLRWVGEGCRPGVFVGDGFKISAAALRRRGLVRTSGHGGSWVAVLTAAGHARLAESGVVVPPPPAVPASSASSPARRAPRYRPGASSSKAVALVARVLEADGELAFGPLSWREQSRLQRLVGAANLGLECPAGCRLVLEERERGAVSVVLVDAIPGTEVVLAPLVVPSEVRDLHPVAVAFRDQTDRHEVSRGLLPRAVLLVHALSEEATRRGYGVSISDGDRGEHRDRWSASRHGHILFTSGELAHHVRLSERGVVRRGAWQHDEDWRRELARLGRSSGTPHPRDYDVGGDGRLRLELGPGYASRGRPRSWSDRVSWSVEERLPELVREMAIRDAEQRFAREQREREREERQRRWEEAMEVARERFLHAERLRVLMDRVDALEDARRVRAYCEACERRGSDPEEREWFAWARAQADRVDPLLTRQVAPDVPEPSPSDLEPYLSGWDPHGPPV